MRKNLLVSLLSVSCILGGSSAINAQIVAPKFDGNAAIDHVGARFAVMAPASIGGVKAFEVANDGSGLSNQWGAAITSVISNVEVVKAYDSLGLNTLLNGTGSYPALTGKFALIYRGGSVEFSSKAQLCQDKGAIGCIIVNNIPGEPVPMGGGTSSAGVTIPVIMVTDIDGAAINSQLRANQTVRVSLTPWGFGYAHDLGLLGDGLSLPPNFAMPASQLATGNGNPTVYKAQSGAYIANFGTSNETNVKLVADVTWTPASGTTATPYHKDSVTFPTFLRSDSIMVGMVNSAYDLHASGPGRFDMNYKLSMAATDTSLSDNSATAVMHVTDSIFSKARYDFAAGHPISPLATAPGGGNSFVWGPLYTTTQAGYAIKSVQFGVAISGQSTLGSVARPVNICVYKWVDASGNSIMESGELSLVGFGSYTFTAADSSFKFVSANIFNVANVNLALKTEANATYWVAADVPGGSLLCVDGVLNYVPRMFVRSRATGTNPAIDLYAPIFDGGDQAVLDANNQLVRPVFLEAYSPTGNFPDSLRYSVQNSGYVPAIAMRISKDVANSVANYHKEVFKEINVFPNPAANGVINYDVKLEKTTAKLFVSIVDALGRNLRTEIQENVKNGSFSFDVSAYAPGQYYLFLNADEGSTVKKFTITGK